MNQNVLKISELNKSISDHINDLDEFEIEGEISGQVKVTDIKGQEQTLNATEIKFSADQPILIKL